MESRITVVIQQIVIQKYLGNLNVWGMNGQYCLVKSNVVMLSKVGADFEIKRTVSLNKINVGIH